MTEKYRLVEDTKTKSTMTFHPNKAKIMNIKQGEKLLKFGVKTCTVHISISSTQEVNEVAISRNIIEECNIPLFCEFEIISTQQDIKIGPFIGIVAGKTEKSLLKNLNYLSDYLLDYDDISGAIAVFSLDQVFPEKQLIQGFILNPQSKMWETRTFSYPSSLFLRIPWFGPKWQQHFQSHMGDTIFNNFHYDKWEIYRLLSKEPELTKHLPETHLCQNTTDILHFLKKHPSAYIKPLNLSRGRGIIKIDNKGKEGLQISHIKNRKAAKSILKNKKQLNSFFYKRLKRRKYLIQKSIDLISENNSIIEFRVGLNKDQIDNWKYIGSYSKQSKPGIIAYNERAGSKFGKGFDILKGALKLSDKEIVEIESLMKKIALKAVQVIENSGVHFANTGIDMGIDRKGDIWIIEVQHCVPCYKRVYNESEHRKTVLQYAKKLAGF